MDIQKKTDKQLIKVEAEFINPFLTTLRDTLKVMGKIDSNMGEMTFVRENSFSGDVMLMFKLEGELKGAIIISMAEETAKKIVSYILLGVPISEIDAMAKNSLKELALRVAIKTGKEFDKTGISTAVTREICFGKPIAFSVVKDFIRLIYNTEHGELTIYFNITKNTDIISVI